MHKLTIAISLFCLLLMLAVPVFAQPITTDLAITLSDSLDPVIAGTTLDYTVAVTNVGPNPAATVQVVAALLTGLTYQSDTAGCVEAPAGTLTCHLGTLAVGETRTFTITALVAADLVHNAGGATLVTSNATVADPSIMDPDATDNSATQDTQVVAAADLAILSMEILNPPAEMLAGEPVDITLHSTITNSGPSAPMDSVFTGVVTASANGIVTPADWHVEQLALGLSEVRAMDTIFTIDCNGGLARTFTFAGEVRPLREGDSDSITANNTAATELAVECVIPVAVDIRPGNPQNPINLRSNGEFQVAIMSNPQFGLDATMLDPATLTLAGATVSQRGNGRYKTNFRDVNGDGVQDLIVHMRTRGIQLTSSDTAATLEGLTFDGIRVRGSDTVRIVGRA